MYKFKLRPDAVTNKDGYLREPNNYYYYLDYHVLLLYTFIKNKFYGGTGHEICM